jgi:hypothetical protein
MEAGFFRIFFCFFPPGPFSAPKSLKSRPHALFKKSFYCEALEVRQGNAFTL